MSDPHGVLLIDKPIGPTSHDIVSVLRRRLKTRRIGHAGTLDPMATGLLVVLVGEATKLEPYLSAQDKSYVATVRLGSETDTLDVTGETLETGELPQDLLEELDSKELPLISFALDRERARETQIPPRFSAISVDGERSYHRARQGEDFELPARSVRLEAVALLAARSTPPEIVVEMRVSKGYYVRSFARDLGRSLGTFGALSALRRTNSGGFSVDRAVAPTGELQFLSLREALRVAGVPEHLLSDEEAQAMAVGKIVPRQLPDASVVACVEPGGRLVCVAELRDGLLKVKRGINSPA